MLLRNSLWNLSGSAIPAIAALVTIPLLIHELGIEGFGIVTLVGSVIGYFGVLDINLTQGSIKYLAEHHASGERQRFAETFWFGAMFYGFLGIAGALGIYWSSAWLATRVFSISPELLDATVLAFQLGAAGFALTQVQNYLLSVPQALQRYDRSAQSEALFGVLVNIASVAAAMAGYGVAGVIAVRIGISLLNIVWLAWLIHAFSLGLGFRWPRRDVLRALSSFSAYAYLSKLASTLHQHGDKLIIGAIAGPVAVTFYSVPVTLSSRILGLTYRLSSVIYPRASALAALDQMAELRDTYLNATRHITYINLVVLGVIILAGQEFLRRWVGEEFVATGYPVLVLMTIALLADSLTNIPSMVNDALGHPEITGKFALARAVIGLLMVYAGVVLGGIVGAATGHLLSCLALGLLFLWFVHGRSVPISLSDMLRLGVGRSMLVGLLIFLILLPFKWLLPPGLASTLLMVAVAGMALVLAGLAFVVNVDERAALRSVARRLVS